MSVRDRKHRQCPLLGKAATRLNKAVDAGGWLGAGSPHITSPPTNSTCVSASSKGQLPRHALTAFCARSCTHRSDRDSPNSLLFFYTSSLSKASTVCSANYGFFDVTFFYCHFPRGWLSWNKRMCEVIGMSQGLYLKVESSVLSVDTLFCNYRLKTETSTRY